MIDALITGKLIRDPATKTGPSGKSFTTFILSVPIGGDAEPVIVSGIAFADSADKIARLKKGDALSVAGSLAPSSWNDKTTGELKTGLNVTVSSALTAYDIKKRRGQNESGGDKHTPNQGRDFDDDIPFC